MRVILSSRVRLWLRWIVFAIILGGVLWAHVDGVMRILPTLSGPGLSALEKRHLRLTEQTVRDMQPDFSQSFSEPLKRMAPHRTDGIAQPLWPWLAAWWHDGADVTGSLRTAAVFRLGIAIGLLMLLGIACARNFTLPAALLIMLIAGLHGFLPVLADYTGTTLYHLFFFIGWIACIYALQRNSLWVYGLIGVLGALAYLAEDRALPLVFVFIIVSTARAIWGWLASHWQKEQSITLWVWRNHVFGLILLVSFFGFIAGPRLAEARQLFGRGFFSYTDEVRWLDDPAEAEDWISRHASGRSLRNLPLEDRLSLPIYRESHTQAEVTARFSRGLSLLWQRYAEDSGWQLVILAGLLLALVLAARYATPKASHAGQRLHPETATTVLFILGAAVTIIGIAAWDSAVIQTDPVRVLLAPLALSLLWACESVLRRARRRADARLIILGYKAVLWMMIAVDITLHWRGS